MNPFLKKTLKLPQVSLIGGFFNRLSGFFGGVCTMIFECLGFEHKSSIMSDKPISFTGLTGGVLSNTEVKELAGM